MGRVSRYKKIRDVDPFSKARQNGSSSNGGAGMIDLSTVGIWGMGNDGRKVKKRSRTSEKLRLMKLNHRRKNMTTNSSSNTKKHKKQNNDDDFKEQDNGIDSAPGGKDDFDLTDLVGSLRKEQIPTAMDDDEAVQTLPVNDSSSSSSSTSMIIDSCTTESPIQSNDTVTSSMIAESLEEPQNKQVAEEFPMNHTNNTTPPVAPKTTTTTTSTIPTDDVTLNPNNKNKTMDRIEQMKLDQMIEQQLLSLASKSSGTTDTTRAAAATAELANQSDRKPGESKNQYNRRVQHETRMIMKRSHLEMTNPEKRRRKKEFLSQKKKKKKKNPKQTNNNNSLPILPQTEITKKNEFNNHNNWNRTDDTVQYKTNETITPNSIPLRSRTAAVFGEQVERPPILRQLPRGATPKKNNNTNLLSTKQTKDQNKFVSTSNNKTIVEKEQQIERQKEMELLRRKVVAHYAAMKSNRKRSGVNFHL